jgi:putative membrane protein
MAGVLALLSLATGIACAQGSKLNDAQIAHIAYTADQIDIQAAQQAWRKARTTRSVPLHRIWSAIIRR